MAVSFARKVFRFFKRIGLSGYSKKRNILGVHPLVVSTSYIFSTLLLAFLLRKIVNLVLADSVFRRMLLEFVATLELCAACFELIIVADNWGVWVYALYLFLLTIWWGLSWGDATACPYMPLEDVVAGFGDISQAALLIFAQILGAIVTFRYVQILWAMELVETHRGKAFEKCVADLQVPMILGALIEGVATGLCRLTSRMLGRADLRYANVLDAFFGTMMVVLDNWGVWVYALYLFLLTIWWGLSWGDATACPYMPLEDVVAGFGDISRAALLIFAQILGAIVTFRYVQILWAMELVETHRGKAFEKCVADLQVPMILGAIIEGVATGLCRLTSRMLGRADLRYANVLDAFFGTMMVVLAFNLSGGYFNPALATSLKWGCQGHTFVEHMVVYWIGATIGSIISVIVFRSEFMQNWIRCICSTDKTE